MNKILKTGIIISSLLPILAFAQVGITPVTPTENINVADLINSISGWALGLLIALAGLFVIYAAYLYLTAAGDEEKVKQAKNVLIYAAVAIAVGLLSRALGFIVKTVLNL